MTKELPGLVTLLWDFIENGESSYGLTFFDLRVRVRKEAASKQSLLAACKLALLWMEEEVENDDPQARNPTVWEAEAMKSVREAIAEAETA